MYAVETIDILTVQYKVAPRDASQAVKCADILGSAYIIKKGLRISKLNALEYSIENAH